MSNPTPKELSDRLEALRRTLRASGKIGTESPENYELVSILNGIARLEGQIEGLRERIETEIKENERVAKETEPLFHSKDIDSNRALHIMAIQRNWAFKRVLGFLDTKPTTEPR
jgi:hypothetical protein